MQKIFAFSQLVANSVAQWIVVGFCVLSLGYFVLTIIGVVAIPDITVRWQGFGNEPTDLNLGSALPATLFIHSVSILGFLPGIRRVLKLEGMHRDFTINLEDVVRAYTIAHAADRQGVFTLPGEFDGVRERFRFMREYPDLQHLSADVLTMAAQMSQTSKEIASRFSDDNVSKAMTRLNTFAEEVKELEATIERARPIASEIRQRSRDLSLRESIAQSQLSRFWEEIDLLLGDIPHSTDNNANVTQLKPPAE